LLVTEARFAFVTYNDDVMALNAPKRESTTAARPVALSIYGPGSEVIKTYIGKLRKRFAKYEASAQEVRELLDRELGDRTLTEELFRQREA